MSKAMVRERKIKNNTATLAGSRDDKHVSAETLGSRENIYQLVDLIDYLFDGIIYNDNY
jgi:hypothetical protein